MIKKPVKYFSKEEGVFYLNGDNEIFCQTEGEIYDSIFINTFKDIIETDKGNLYLFSTGLQNEQTLGIFGREGKKLLLLKTGKKYHSDMIELTKLGKKFYTKEDVDTLNTDTYYMVNDMFPKTNNLEVTSKNYLNLVVEFTGRVKVNKTDIKDTLYEFKAVGGEPTRYQYTLSEILENFYELKEI